MNRGEGFLASSLNAGDGVGEENSPWPRGRSRNKKHWVSIVAWPGNLGVYFMRTEQEKKEKQECIVKI